MGRLRSQSEPPDGRSWDRLVSELVDCRAEAVALARGLIGRQDAEDVAQEAIARVLRTAARGVVIENPRAYLRTTVRRAAADHLQSARRESVPGALPELVSCRSDPQAAVELGELLAAIEGLPERQQVALIATALTNHKHSQLADVLQTTPAGVRQLVRRARRRLRDTLGAWIPGPAAWLAIRARRLVAAAGASGAAHAAATAVVVTVVVVAPKPPHPPHPRRPPAPSPAGAALGRLDARRLTPPWRPGALHVSGPHPLRIR